MTAPLELQIDLAHLMRMLARYTERTARRLHRGKFHQFHPRPIRIVQIQLPLAVFADLFFLVVGGLPAARFQQ